MDWNDCSPRELAAESDLGPLVDSCRSIASWTDRPAEVMDFVFRTRIARTLAQSWREDPIVQLVEWIHRAVRPSKRAEIDRLAKSYASRWQALEDVLQACLDDLRSQERAPEVLSRAHVGALLERLASAGGPVSQETLRDESGLGPANMTRILNLMERHRLVRRSRVGLRNTVEMGEAGRGALESLALAARRNRVDPTALPRLVAPKLQPVILQPPNMKEQERTGVVRVLFRESAAVGPPNPPLMRAS